MLAIPETPLWNKHGTYHHSIQRWLPDRSFDCMALKKCQRLDTVRWTFLRSLRLNPEVQKINISQQTIERRKKKHKPQRQTRSIWCLGNLPGQAAQKLLLPKLVFAWNSLWLDSDQIDGLHPRKNVREGYIQNSGWRVLWIPTISTAREVGHQKQICSLVGSIEVDAVHSDGQD